MDLNSFGNAYYGTEGIDFDRVYLECQTMFAQAEVLLIEKRVQESAELLFKILQCNSHFGKAYNHLGWIYDVNYGNYIRAEEYYKNAIKYEPEYAPSYINYARLLSNTKRFDELKAHLEMSLNIPSISEESLYNEYAIMHEIQQNSEVAMNYFVKAAMATFDENRLATYQESINRCKTKLELKKLISNHTDASKW
jgi:tetratricopeptide (TPR) repeat protein